MKIQCIPTVKCGANKNCCIKRPSDCPGLSRHIFKLGHSQGEKQVTGLFYATIFISTVDVELS